MVPARLALCVVAMALAPLAAAGTLNFQNVT